jgi:hypothetical protein
LPIIRNCASRPFIWEDGSKELEQTTRELRTALKQHISRAKDRVPELAYVIASENEKMVA